MIRTILISDIKTLPKLVSREVLFLEKSSRTGQLLRNKVSFDIRIQTRPRSQMLAKGFKISLFRDKKCLLGFIGIPYSLTNTANYTYVVNVNTYLS